MFTNTIYSPPNDILCEGAPIIKKISRTTHSLEAVMLDTIIKIQLS